MDDRRTPLARARGLGSAKSGVGHWWAQRITAIALIPLVVWFAISLVMLVSGFVCSIKLDLPLSQTIGGIGLTLVAASNLLKLAAK